MSSGLLLNCSSESPFFFFLPNFTPRLLGYCVDKRVFLFLLKFTVSRVCLLNFMLFWSKSWLCFCVILGIEGCEMGFLFLWEFQVMRAMACTCVTNVGGLSQTRTRVLSTGEPIKRSAELLRGISLLNLNPPIWLYRTTMNTPRMMIGEPQVRFPFLQS